MTWEGAVGAPERLDELKTMCEDGHEHRSLQLDRQQHGCSPNLMPLTVTACPRARSDLTCLSGSTAALRAPCALPCVAMLVGSCGRAGTRGSRLQGSGMYRVSKSDESLAGQACNTPAVGRCPLLFFFANEPWGEAAKPLLALISHSAR